MEDTELTEFQTRMQEQVRQLLAQHGREAESQEVLRADVPFYSKDTEIAVKVLAGDIEVWLYDDEASYSLRGNSRIFERDDFGSPTELAEAFLSALGEALGQA